MNPQRIRHQASEQQSIVVDLFEGCPVGGTPVFMQPDADDFKAGFFTEANTAGIEAERNKVAQDILPVIRDVLGDHTRNLSTEALRGLALCIANIKPYADVLPVIFDADPASAGGFRGATEMSRVYLLSDQGTVLIPAACVESLAAATGVMFERKRAN